MDNVTHALAGLVFADVALAAVQRRHEPRPTTGFRSRAIWLGVIAAELPDADLLYSGPVVGMGKLGYMLHHRGHTHTIVFALLSAALLWWLFTRGLPKALRSERRALAGVAVAGTLSHLLLDFTNSYGVHPFWPLDNRWYYGDAVFIIEPWLWIAMIPPLLFGPRTRWGRVLLTLLLLLILVAAWTLGEVRPPVALVLTVVAALWTMTQWRLTHRTPSRAPFTSTPAWFAVAALVMAEAAFFASSARARHAVRSAVNDATIQDIVLTPGAANPLCFAGFVIAGDSTIRVSTATVAPWPTWRTAAACQRARDNGQLPIADAVPSTRVSTDAVAWRADWSRSRGTLALLAGQHCEVAAALRFMRVPVWEARDDGTLRLADARFGIGSGGFADITVDTKKIACPLPANAWIPPWTPPTASP